MADITIKELRQTYPQYTDWSDAKLAKQFEKKMPGYKVIMSDIASAAPSLTPDSRPKWTENIWGDGEIDTVGEDIGAAIGSGMERGIAAIPGLPGAIANTVNMARGTYDENDRYFGFPEAMAKMDEITGDAGVGTGYQPETREGKFFQTGADFFAGAVMPGAAFNNLGRTVVAPAMLSESLGQLTEGTKLEPYARMLGGLFGGRSADVVESALAGGKVSKEHMRAVDALRAKGVKPTAGQATNHERLLNAEAKTGKGALLEASDDSFTDAVIQTSIPSALRSEINVPVGTNATDAVVEIRRGTGKVMDDLAANNQFDVTPDIQLGFQRLSAVYDDTVSAGGKSNFFENLSNQLANTESIGGEGYQYYRTQLGRLAQSPDASTREAALDARTILDDAMEASIKARGNKTELARYKAARQGYRDLLIVERALQAASARGSRPVITPASLGGATKAKDAMGYVQGRTSFDSLIRNGADVLKKTNESGTAGNIFTTMGGNMIPASMGASLGTAMGFDPLYSALAGVAASPLRNKTLASRPVQKWMEATARRGDRSGITSIPAAISASRQGQY